MKRLFYIFIIILLTYNMAHPYSLSDEKTMNLRQIETLTGNKIIDFKFSRISNNNGKILLMGRDYKTRKLEWFLLNPMTQKLEFSGGCPFQTFNEYDISPDGNKIAVHSSYPSALWAMDIKSGKWVTLFKPELKKEGLFFISLSPIKFVDDTSFYTIMDLKDKEGFVKDTFVVEFNILSGEKKEIVSLVKLKKDTFDKLYKNKELPTGVDTFIPVIKSVIFGVNGNLLYVFENSSKKRSTSFLYQFSAPSSIQQIEGKGMFYPLDYDGITKNILYRKATKEGYQIIFYSEGKGAKALIAKAILGFILNKNYLGILAINGKSLDVYFGKAGETLTMIKNIKEPLSGKFTKNGKNLVLVGKNKIVGYKIEY
jgi:hypothetical protein